jgi:hypothetical protein
MKNRTRSEKELEKQRVPSIDEIVMQACLHSTKSRAFRDFVRKFFQQRT